MDLVDKFHEVGIKHFSASSLNKPQANFIFEKIYLSAEQRKNIIVGENAALGTAVHEAIQSVLCHGQGIDEAIKEAETTFDFHPANKSQEKRERFREDIADMVHVGVGALAADFGGSQEERRIELELDGVVLPVIGYVDLFKDGKLAEIKTKAARAGAVKKDGTRSWSKGSLPKEPAWPHVLQAAIYNKATGAEPNIVYVSAHDSIIYSPENCEKLSDEYLSYAIQEIREKAIRLQNLIAISNDPKVLAGLLEPDFGSFFWADEFMTEARELWKL